MTETPRRGASAARITITGDVVSKFDTVKTGTRVRQQGIWLFDYPLKHMPEVLRVTSQGYEMLRYNDIPLDALVDEPMPLIELMWNAYRGVETLQRRPAREWTRNPFVALDVQALDAYTTDICRQLGAPTIAFRMLELRPQIAWPQRLVWTHGDLIIDNVMRDLNDGKLILIDPIPPCSALPSLAVVDYGRVVQSAAGYEQIRYTATTPKDDAWQDRVTTVLNWIARASSFDGTYDQSFDGDAVRGSLFYSIIHMLRGARTAPDVNTRDAMIDQARNLLEELEAWMR